MNNRNELRITENNKHHNAEDYHFEWDDILRDLEALREVTLEMKCEKYYL